ncbi:hypothetical protein FYK55_05935 [Roseiconus nitratireducens]|uniref:Nitrogen fixation protein FixH n=1 Tax=Roseiconus nitratireducens TaxID=2605748 RepID=A0A5M6DCC3_9BACT|nr:FixH family protein [Roseiconus nitratireducens]KAA5545208.1 hypothetical protein FYK55_05935 [Roseiconus nitratireducens]
MNDPIPESDAIASRTPTRRELADANRRAAWRWGSLVVCLLGLQVALGVAAIVLSTGDPSVAVVPDYYARSMRWDQTRALERDSQALGWSVQYAAVMLPVADPVNRAVARTDRSLRIDLRNAQGNPVVLADGQVEVYRHARASDVLVRPVRPLVAEPGVLVVPGCFDHPGWWEVELDVTDVDGARYVQSTSLLVDQLAALGSAGAGTSSSDVSGGRAD